ncbi:DUF4233 domain-containing protein [Agromyces aerolatus]|uniref:DUF4233 domain-containing protein n=1 Tax=Agromyces sp. LY-1074 TaxID=3074080 RepID=UPI002855EF20|nr:MULTISPECIES: DUF4233 domain-containing protein [unclassified Agromyces]MDR5700695.1 DUF4233 domain-containing protein [Agromyces sp. LY-1074]MDR5707216.1 DUF4233 domain-containing protein [Agromyces sp. LY-1358]
MNEAAAPEPAMTPGPDVNPEPAAAPAPRSLQRSLASIVLAFEIFVVFLAALAIWGLAVDGETPFGLPRWSILVVGGVLVLLTIATIGLLRHRWAYWLGWGIQVVILAAGILNPAMIIVGLVFGGMWAYCMVAGARIDRNRAAHDAAGKERE